MFMSQKNIINKRHHHHYFLGKIYFWPEKVLFLTDRKCSDECINKGKNICCSFSSLTNIVYDNN